MAIVRWTKCNVEISNDQDGIYAVSLTVGDHRDISNQLSATISSVSQGKSNFRELASATTSRAGSRQVSDRERG
jgi:hypothetical protein